MNDGILIFIHIPKAAGQTMNAVLARQYGRAAVLAYRGPVGKDPPDFVESLGSGTRVVTGHLSFGIHTKIQRRCSYITFIREPIARVVSLYKYIRKNPKHHLYDQARNQTLADFVLSGIDSEETENGQTRLIAGVNENAVTPEQLEMAKENLTKFLVPGVVERFDESLILAKRKLGWKKVPLYVRANVSAGDAQIGPDALQAIRERNQLDIELYGAANRLLDESTRMEGLSAKADLAAFRVTNRVAQVYKTSPRRRGR